MVEPDLAAAMAAGHVPVDRDPVGLVEVGEGDALVRHLRGRVQAA